MQFHLRAQWQNARIIGGKAGDGGVQKDEAAIAGAKWWALPAEELCGASGVRSSARCQTFGVNVGELFSYWATRRHFGWKDIKGRDHFREYKTNNLK